MAYQPPFTITPAIVRLISEISEQLGRLSVLDEAKNLRLRRINRIRSIQGSLAIEGNTLSEEQITAILDGKRVIAPPREVLEARNAIKAYDQFDGWQPENEKHLLTAHDLLMAGLIDDAGRYRTGSVGVMSGKQVLHMAPPAKRVGKLIGDLLKWLAETDQHPLIASSIFHYEFEFIHPFADGNGRMGRLWQTLILKQWNPIFGQLPVESIVHEHQTEYYRAINQSTQQSDSAAFVEFMCAMILSAVGVGGSHQVTHQETHQVSFQIISLLKLLADKQQAMTRVQLQAAFKLTDRVSFRQRYLQPALKGGFIEMTIPDKPNSRLQCYRLTSLGLIKLGSKES